jgi:hypothetical protein
MIPVSLLLILVAVALLALGLTSGSSGLLIASIAASLLAAVALVIGARRNAGARRAATATQPAARPAAPASATADAEPEPDFATEFAAARSAPADFSGGPIAPDFSATDFSGPGFSGPAAPDSAVYTEEPAFAEQAGYSEQPAYPEQPAHSEQPAYTEQPAHPEQPAYSEQPGYPEQPVAPAAARTEEFGFGLDDDPPWRTRATPESEVAAAAAPDYDRAASAIHAARSEQPEENQWRRDSHAEAAARSDLNRADASRADANRADLNATDLGAATGLRDEFDEPDADDPDDEPLPQSVQPSDAVRVARLDAEVLVVDGRPRYHLADCPHLVGRLTEPIPVNEAVELGFSPCGLCRPVDRLVAAAARH